eukprot:gnl/TRDRNA2_/TRDRNA2_168271_c3_seq1.p1 gnl/TRDRNA2_/TRDRNA2_168271_c3~~gnl/TRDRNA2_/TRDRNA2_168271_c3_seq1.p1  ORF type:complete len:360 (+),score=49.85 gnl/TRDRNA2_/TRDRNA2_168271_c3_seq1:62-1081(+)
MAVRVVFAVVTEFHADAQEHAELRSDVSFSALRSFAANRTCDAHCKAIERAGRARCSSQHAAMDGTMIGKGHRQLCSTCLTDTATAGALSRVTVFLSCAVGLRTWPRLLGLAQDGQRAASSSRRLGLKMSNKGKHRLFKRRGARRKDDGTKMSIWDAPFGEVKYWPKGGYKAITTTTTPEPEEEPKVDKYGKPYLDSLPPGMQKRKLRRIRFMEHRIEIKEELIKVHGEIQKLKSQLRRPSASLWPESMKQEYKEKMEPLIEQEKKLVEEIGEKKAQDIFLSDKYRDYCNENGIELERDRFEDGKNRIRLTWNPARMRGEGQEKYGQLALTQGAWAAYR